MVVLHVDPNRYHYELESRRASCVQIVGSIKIGFYHSKRMIRIPGSRAMHPARGNRAAMHLEQNFNILQLNPAEETDRHARRKYPGEKTGPKALTFDSCATLGRC